MNPARRLHNTLLGWINTHGTKTVSVSDTRGLSTSEGMQEQLLAVEDLLQVVRGLDELENRGVPVSIYRRYVDQWSWMVLAYPGGWSGNQTVSAVYQGGPLDHLETLAHWFDDRQPGLTTEHRHNLGSITEQAQAILDDDDTLSPVLRLYLGRLLREIRNALDDEQLGERFDFEQAAQRLWVTLIAAADQSTDPTHKAKWSDTAKRFVWDSAVSIIGNGPTLLLAITGLA